jgi:hypothetical protein
MYPKEKKICPLSASYIVDIFIKEKKKENENNNIEMAFINEKNKKNKARVL